ncbi:MAG: hypothetical protein Q4A60_01925 [Pasteurellaceae bacterium]|nr:hypothetical protein [Pasteurellaceae bacterium]
MQIIKKIAPLALALSASACLNLNLEGVEIGGLEREPGVLTKFQCENGYKGSVKVKNNGKTTLRYEDGNNIYLPTMQNIGTAENPIYVNEKKTLRWQKTGNQVQFTYPAPDYAQSGQLLQTSCRTN